MCKHKLFQKYVSLLLFQNYYCFQYFPILHTHLLFCKLKYEKNTSNIHNTNNKKNGCIPNEKKVNRSQSLETNSKFN